MRLKTYHAALKKSEENFVRDGYDREAIKRYKQKFESGQEKLLTVQEDTFMLVDGYHRGKPLEELEREKAKVEEIDIPDDEILTEFYRRNKDDGVSFSREERNRFIQKLYDEQGKTYEEIGEIVGLDPS